MKKLLNFLIYFTITFSLSAQIKFNIFEPGSGTIVRTIVQSSDKGYILAGDAFINGPSNSGYLAKLDSTGNTTWKKTIGYSNTVFEMNEIIKTKDSNYVVAGRESASIYILKLSLSGDTLWTHSVIFNCQPSVTSLQQTFDDGFIVSGFLTCTPSYQTKMLLVKFDSLGNFQWSKSYVITNYQNIANSVVQMPDSNYLLAGYSEDTSITPDKDGCILIVSSNGTPLSNKIYTNSNFRNCEIVDASISDSTLHFLINSHNNSYKLINSDLTGNINWCKEYSIANPCYNCPVELLLDPDGGYIITSDFSSGFMLRLDQTGDYLWDCYLASPYHTINTDDGGYAIVMNHYENLANQIGIVKMDSAGNTTGCVGFGTGIFYDTTTVDTGTAIINFNQEGSPINLVFPISTSNLSLTTGCIFIEIPEISQQNPIRVFPNPSIDELNIALDKSSGDFSIQIINLLGEIIYSENFHFNISESIKIKNDFAPGIYTVILRNEKELFSKKIIIARN